MYFFAMKGLNIKMHCEMQSEIFAIFSKRFKQNSMNKKVKVIFLLKMGAKEVFCYCKIPYTKFVRGLRHSALGNNGILNTTIRAVE